MTAGDSIRGSGDRPEHVTCKLVLDEANLGPFVERIVRSVAQSNGSRWMTLVQACHYLQWSQHRVYKLTAARAIPHIKHEGRLLFNRDELDQWLNQHHEGPRVPPIV